MVVRNEALRLPATLKHYRDLGAARFFIVDNNSDDGTLDLLTAQPDVHLFSTDESYAASGYGVGWINAVLEAFGNGHWTLTVDADEQFIYPHYERIKLPQFCRYLDGIGARAVFCLLLDMYGGETVNATPAPGTSLLESCPYFDPGPYRTVKAPDFPHLQVYGGVRERIFHHLRDQGYHSPTLSKVPMVKWQSGMKFTLSTHALTPAPLAEITGVLLHFKFLSDFHDRVATEVQRREHFDQAREYRAYHELMTATGPVTLRDANSVRFKDSAQLVALNLMRSTPAYEQFAQSGSR